MIIFSLYDLYAYIHICCACVRACVCMRTNIYVDMHQIDIKFGVASSDCFFKCATNYSVKKI